MTITAVSSGVYERTAKHLYLHIQHIRHQQQHSVCEKINRNKPHRLFTRDLVNGGRQNTCEILQKPKQNGIQQVNIVQQKSRRPSKWGHNVGDRRKHQKANKGTLHR